jgi:uncharacterized protein (DUF433 family)
MEISQIEDRGGVPAIVGTRITVNDVLVYLFEPTMTEETISHLLDLTREQVAAVRAYILINPDTTLARHLEIEARSELAVNPPEVVERLKQTMETFAAFKAWFAKREAEEAIEKVAAGHGTGRYPSFREWLAESESRQSTGT